MQSTQLNAVQLQLLQMFSHMHSDEELLEVKTLLADYYFKKVDRLGAALAADKGWTSEVLDAMTHDHLRTPYR